MELKLDQLPPAVREGAQRLFADEIYFAPIRHHSPACAFAIKSLLLEIKPVAVLIEGADSFSRLIPLLLDPDTRPPVAILAQTTERNTVENDDKDSPTQTRSAFFPLCDYSPEWVALCTGHKLGAALAFIDLPWREKNKKTQQQTEADLQSDSLQAERYLAHSSWLQKLAQNIGCRDHHELWDHLFELLPTTQLADWKTFLTEVFCWCAMARLDYEPEVLEAENSLPRERHMARWIKTWREKIDGPIVVVTGGFHTLELLNWTTAEPMPGDPKADETQWLIRYGFEQLDALNSYAAGMPSPAYYQLLWQGLMDNQPNPWLSATESLLLQLVHQTRTQELADTLSTADLQAAILQASRLADLRGHPGPGRTDLLDAITSCFLKRASDDGHSGLLRDARRLLAGTRLGDIPASAGSPPLVEDARRAASANGVRLEDSEARTTKLDLYRKPAHRLRSRFFQLMSYLNTDLARWQSGPDFLTGTRLEMLFEEWRYAWSPTVEARLVELSLSGVDLQSVALAKLEQEERALGELGQARSAARAVQLLTRACLIGLHHRLPALFELLEAHLNEDPDFGSVVSCGHQLLTLWQAREPLGVQENPNILQLLIRVWSAAIFLLPGLHAIKKEQEAEAIGQLIAVREMVKRVGFFITEKPSPIDQSLLYEQLQNLIATPGCAPGIEAAAASLLYLESQWDGKRLASSLASHFGPGAQAQDAVRFLKGMIATAPELLLHEPELLIEVNRLLSHWEESDFIAFLPDLRHAFTRLNPQETDRLAQAIGKLQGSDSQPLYQSTQGLSERDLLEGLQLQQSLIIALAEDGLTHWFMPPEQNLTEKESRMRRDQE